MIRTTSNEVALEVMKLERAADALLRGAVGSQPLYREDEHTPVSIGDALRSIFEDTPAQRAAARLLENPVGAACRQAVTTIGERLFEIGGYAMLDEVRGRLSERDSSYVEQLRLAILSNGWRFIHPEPAA